MARQLIFIAIALFPLLVQTEQPPALLITEVFYDTPGRDGEEEWVEIVNAGTAVVDLSNIKLGDEEKAGGSEGMFRFPSGATIAAGEVIVVAQTAVGFANLYGRLPSYEFQDSHPDVPNMRRFPLWGDDAFALGNSGDEVLLLGDSNELLDGLNYGDSHHFFSPSIGNSQTGQSLERAPSTCDSDTAVDWQAQSQPSPWQLNQDGACAAPIPTPEPASLTPIGEIQGNRDSSLLVNQQVEFRGVVTGLHADRNSRGIVFHTLYVQDLPGQSDGDPTTSDGIAVFTGRRRPSAQIGDQVRVSGEITEFFGLTEVDDNGIEIEVEASGLALPEPVLLKDDYVDLEHLEGMRVAVGETAVVTNPTFRSCGFNVSLTTGRLFRRTAEDSLPPILPILHHTETDDCGAFPQLKTADRVTGLVGPLTYHFDQFKIVLQEPEALNIEPSPIPVPPVPPAVGEGQFSIASFNVENLFDSVDDTGDDAEPKLTADEIETRLTKISHAISQTLGCPTLIGVQEVENEALLLQLANRLEADCGFVYAISHRESADGRGIDVALMSDPHRVGVVSIELRQGCTRISTGIIDPTANCGAGQEPLFSRPPLLVDLAIDGQRHLVVVNHFKSKRGGEAETAPRRLAQAVHINGLVDEALTAVPDARIIVMGDFNDFEESPSTQTMVVPNGRLTSVLSIIPDQERYSFIFGGASQLIDDILVSPALSQQLVTAVIQHSNADFPFGWETDTSLERLAYRAADHDLPLAVFALEREVVETAVVPTIEQATAIPAAPTPMPEPPVEEDSSFSFPWLWLFLIGGLILVGGIVVWQILD